MATRTSVKFSFYIKRTKLLSNGEAPIYFKIKVDRQKVEMAISKSINPELWSTDKNGAVGNTRDAREVNSYIAHIRQQMSNSVMEMREDGVEITAETLKYAFLGNDPNQRTILSVFDQHNEQVKLLIGKQYAKATYGRYVTCRMHLADYIKFRDNKDDLPLRMISTEFINGFELYLKANRNIGHNSATKYLKNFKKIVNICLGNGWMRVNPFINIKFHLNKVDRGFLTEDELLAIKNKDFGNIRLQQVADTFLFGCYTGLAYSDLKQLSPENIITDEKGVVWIHTKRQKTDMETHVPLLPTAKKIIEKYRYHPYCVKNNVLLPVLSNQKLNAYLKEIADVCEINKMLTSHIARHTFATTITLNNDIPIESVSKMLGHSSISMTQIYAKMLDKKVNNDMSKIMDKFKDD